MSLAFYQKFWHVVGLSITESCKAWFDEGRLPKQVNGTIFVLIPKKKKLGNSARLEAYFLMQRGVQKFSKVLTNRLKETLPALVAETQSAFI